MRAGAPEGPVAGTLAAHAKVQSFAARVEAAALPFAVAEDGRVIGTIDRTAVMDVLVGRPVGSA
jgi:glycine betaine/proline transport system ATP-binding protein